jgi:uncharacterized protein YjbI with pentapeptide repeats
MDSTFQLRSLVKARRRARDLDLHGAALADVDLSGLNADRLDLRAVDFRRAKLHAARLGACRLEGARLDESDWSRATLRGCLFDSAQGVGACFDGACVEDSSVQAADLTRASLRGARLSETSFARAVLRATVLDDARGVGVEFRGADLGSATLIGARLDEADFRGADLRGADLSSGRFRGADFRGALLDAACFDGADVAGARFDQGAGPGNRADSRDRSKEAATAGQVPLAALNAGLDILRRVLTTHDSPDRELIDRLQRTVDELAAPGTDAPEEWRPWLEPLMQRHGEGPPDLKAVLNALCESPIGPRLGSGLHEDATANLLGQIRQFADKLEGSPLQSPREWTPWLERLADMTDGKQPLDFARLFDALPASAGHPPPRANRPKTSSDHEAGIPKEVSEPDGG